jgi:hypothetical protein
LQHCTEASDPAVLVEFPCLCFLGSSLSVHACHPRDIAALHRGFWPNGLGRVSMPLSPGFKSQRARLSPPRCLTCLLSLQGFQWVWGIVVVPISWSGHPELSKNNNNNNCFEKPKKATISLNQNCQKNWLQYLLFISLGSHSRSLNVGFQC